ncbi:DUF1127 domain-containing protein, partial [Klebsiella pneumoniae]
ILFHHKMHIYCAAKQELTMNIFKKIKTYASNRRAMHELGSLDDRTLQDLGVSRSHIRSAVTGATRG